MAWDENTTFRHAGFRQIAAFRAVRNLGCIIMWKPWFLSFGVEIWQGGFGVYAGLFCAGFGPIRDDLPWYYKDRTP